MPSRRVVSPVTNGAIRAIVLCAWLMPSYLIAQFSYLKLHSFGPGAAAIPDTVINGRGEAFYGTGTDDSRERPKNTIFKLNRDGTGFRVLFKLTNTNSQGQDLGAIMQGTDGSIYGVAKNEGPFDRGVIFRLAENGGFNVLYAFPRTNDGAFPQGQLVQAQDGFLFGTTVGGGCCGKGTVFRLKTDGSDYEVVHSFGQGIDGAYPTTGVLLGSDGVLYGNTQRGGTNNVGTVFRLRQDGQEYRILHHFTQSQAEGRLPNIPLWEINGTLFGGTTAGGASNSTQNGTIFRIDREGSAYRVLHAFGESAADGNLPAALAPSADGRIVCASLSYTATNWGALLSIHPDGTDVTVIHRFGGYSSADGTYPSGVFSGNSGELYGFTVRGGTADHGTIFQLAAQGNEYRKLYNFNLYNGQPVSPSTKLAQGKDGWLYGSSRNGGEANGGTIFRVSPESGEVQLVYSFTRRNGGGSAPKRILCASDGWLYGTTQFGGSNGLGCIFRLSTSGTQWTVLHSFGSSPQDGSTPEAGLTEGTDGFLYGTTMSGGTQDAGTIFKLRKDGTGYSSIASLDSTYPVAEITQNGGIFYLPSEYPFGRILAFPSDGSFLSSFNVSSAPNAQLLIGRDRLLYCTGRYNTAFKVRFNSSPSGITNLHTFTGNNGDGREPVGGLEYGSDGALYGITWSGGAFGFGTIFAVNDDGSRYRVVHSFGGGDTEGRTPQGGLLRATNGAFFGVTSAGGVHGLGTVFKIEPAATLSIQRNNDLQLAGPERYRYKVEQSSVIGKPAQWSPITTQTLASAPSIITNVPSDAHQRFYRALLIP